jgi:Bacterial regulatory helix-turn-helix protein, lysR family
MPRPHLSPARLRGCPTDGVWKRVQSDIGSPSAREKDFVGRGTCLGDMESAMELRHLRYFIAVAEEGSLTLAAEKWLHTAQPSLSRQIRSRI